MKIFGGKAFLRTVALAAIGLGTSGCVYDMGLGYASDGYYDDGYYDDADGCDPYGGYDSYYQCDYGRGFNNIGYGGGYYDNYWYPGYGFFLFDNVGRRYPMRDHHRRYWGEKRHNWYREHRGRNRDGGGYHRRGRDHSNDVAPGNIGRPDRNRDRWRSGEDRRNGEGRGGRDGRWRSGENRDPNAVPSSNPELGQRPGRSRDRGDRIGRPDRRRDNDSAAMPVPQPPQSYVPAQGEERRERRGGDGRENRRPMPQPEPSAVVEPAPRAQRAAPAPRPERPARVQRQNSPGEAALPEE